MTVLDLFRPLFPALLLVPTIGFAHDGDHEHDEPTPRVADTEAHRPTAIPDRIILTWTGDPARSQAVTWRTDTTVRKAVAQIAPAEAGPGFVKDARQVDAVTTPLISDLSEALYHTAEFEDLDPSTQYAYRVGDGTNWSEWIHFNTASDQPEPFSFIYFGDAQNDVKSLWSRVIRGAYSDAPKARFIVHAGDLINRANRDAEWGEWHAAGGWVNAMVPNVVVPGNHEYERTSQEPDARSELSGHWRPQFAMPEQAPPGLGLEETTYYIDYQGVRIVALNSNRAYAEQAEWLEGVLSENPNRWTIVTFHHPVFSPAKGRDNPQLRRLWKPIFDRYGVDLVLQGHDHTYARSGLRASENVPTGLNTRDPEGGTVYVVSVSGPKMYNLDRADWMRRVAEDTQLYQIISLDNDTLKFQARTATGELYDAFELHKRDGQSNLMIERIPDRPERTRPPMPEAAGGR